MDTIDLSAWWPDTIQVDTADGCSLWQLGHSHKAVFDSVSPFLGIATDTIQPYAVNLDCSFSLRPELHPYGWYWYSGFILFEHRFETDSLKDGGFLQFSCDSGATWSTFGTSDWIDNGLEVIYHNYAGVPNPTYWDPGEFQISTIRDTIPAFTGLSSGWEWSGIMFYTPPVKWEEEAYPCSDFNSPPLIRFRFLSDSIDDGLSGWMIRNIVFGVAGTTGSVLEPDSFPFRLAPNPTSSVTQIQVLDNSNPIKVVRLNDLKGQEYPVNESNNLLDLTLLPSGIYVVTFVTDKGVFRQRLVRN
ncbi:MAG: T9SS type A sorting domain-containing protein [Flavobacteriales bacterium]|nr:T9SS type A sorting domain-containing protein [Flavobacteriales bacterium]